MQILVRNTTSSAAQRQLLAAPHLRSQPAPSLSPLHRACHQLLCPRSTFQELHLLLCSTFKECSSNPCSSIQPQTSPSVTSLCSRQKTRLRSIPPLHAHNLPRQPSLPSLEQPTSPCPRPTTHYPRPLIYSVFCSHRWVTCDWKPEAPLQPCATLPLPSAQRPPPGRLRSCTRAPSSPPVRHREGGFTREEPGKSVSPPLRPQRPLPSLSLGQAGSSLAPALPTARPPPPPPRSEAVHVSPRVAQKSPC